MKFARFLVVAAATVALLPFALHGGPDHSPKYGQVNLEFTTTTRRPVIIGVPELQTASGILPRYYRTLQFSGERHYASGPVLGKEGCPGVLGSESITPVKKRTALTGSIVYSYDLQTDAGTYQNLTQQLVGEVNEYPWPVASCNPAPLAVPVSVGLPGTGSAILYGEWYRVANNPHGLTIVTPTKAADDGIARWADYIGDGIRYFPNWTQNNHQMILADEDTPATAEQRARVTIVAQETTPLLRTTIGGSRATANGLRWTIRDTAVRIAFRTQCPGDYTLILNYKKGAWREGQPTTFNEAWTVTEELSLKAGELFEHRIDLPRETDKEIMLESVAVMKAGDCGAESCSAGGLIAGNAVGPHSGSIYWQVSLGHMKDGRSAGNITLHEQSITPAIYTPAKLLPSLPNNTVLILKNAGNPRQILAPQALADIVTTGAQAYEVRFYERSQAGTPDASGLYAPTGSPYIVWKVENPDITGVTSNRLRMSKVAGGVTRITEVDESQAGKRIFSEAGGLRVTETTGTNENGDRVETIVVKNAAGGISSKKTVHFRTFGWGEERVKEILDPDGAALTTQWAYYTDPVFASYRQPRSITRPDGFVETFEYFGDGTLANHGTPTWDNQSLFEYTSEQLIDLNGDGLLDRLTTVTATMQQLTNLRREFIVNWGVAAGANKERDRYQATNGGAAWNTVGNLVTRERFTPDGKLLYRRTPDGVLTRRSTTTYGDGTTAVVERRGAPDATNESVVDGTQTTEVYSAKGVLLSTTAIDIASSQTLQSLTTLASDSAGRPTRLAHLDGAEEVRTYCDACAGLESISLRGETTNFSYDALGRKIEEVRSAGTTILAIARFKYDADGRLRQRIRGDLQSSAETVVASTTYDFAGRVASETSLGQGTTNYSYAFAPGNRTIMTSTFADGGTRIESRGASGSVKSIRGTAVAPVDHAYTTRVWDGRGDGYFHEIRRLNDDNSISLERQSVSMLGELEYTEFGDGATSHRYLDAAGRLSREVDPDGVTTLHAYDGEGRLAVTAVDLNRNGTIDYAGGDRIVRTLEEVGLRDGVTVRRTTTQVWATASADSATTVSVSETSADGLRSWQTTNGLTTATVTAHTAGGGRAVTTTGPDGTVTQQTFLGDRLVSAATSHAALGTLMSAAYGYDSAGRLRMTTDARNGASTTTYDANDRVLSVTTPDPDPTRTGPGCDPQVTTLGYDVMGRTTSVTQPDGTVANTTYYVTGAVKRTWGTRAYPVEHTYDVQGRLKTMTTWQNFAADTGRSVTTWNYDNTRGFLANKRYPDNTGPNYSYTGAGRLRTRTWARGITTIYSYTNGGEFSTADYSDTTPDVSVTFDRLGRLASKTDGAGTSTYSYQGVTSLPTSEANTAGTLAGFTLNRAFDAQQRLSTLGVSHATAGMPTAAYSYDAASRLQAVTSGSHSATYAYVANAALVGSVTFAENGTTRLTTSKSYDALNRLLAITNTPNGQSAALNYTYTYNSANQRTRAAREDASYWSYTYDPLGQVTGGSKFLADGTPLLGHGYGWSYDDIGNRKTATVNGQIAAYTPNNLNQYTQRTVPGVIDGLGSAVSDANVAVGTADGAWLAQRQGELFYKQVPVSNTTAAAGRTVTIAALKPGAGTAGADLADKVTRPIFVPQTPEPFSYDADGNMKTDARWTYTWDAENRLVRMETSSAVIASGLSRQQLDFAYDGQSRRVSKTVSVYPSATSTPQVTATRFIYDGWNLLAEVNSGNAPVRTYVWGLDLSGSLHGAGGVGGLLTVTDASTGAAHFAAFDGNGNVAGLIKASDATLAAKYEYSVFGELLLTDGPAAATNPFRFSTKFTDAESGLLCYGYRYYIPETGRWLSRDPLGENGGTNLYGMVGNDPLNDFDALGLFASQYHESITRNGLRGAALGARCLNTIVTANVGQDDGAVVGIFGARSGPFFNPLNHGDDNRIAETIQLMRQRMDAVLRNQCVDCNQADGALRTVGMIFHALQDLYSHSTYVETFGRDVLNPPDVPLWNMWNPNGTPNVPNGVNSGTYQYPRDRAPGPNTHRHLHKDEPDSERGGQLNNRGVSNFRLAEDAATRATTAVWNGLWNQLSAEQRTRLTQCCNGNAR